LRDKIRQLIQAALGHTQAALLRQLNLLLRAGPTTTATEPRKRPLASWTIMSGASSGAGSPAATTANPKPGSSHYFSAQGTGAFHRADTSQEGKSRVLTLYGWPAPPSNAILRSGNNQPLRPLYTQYFAQRRCFAWRIRGTGRTTPRARLVRRKGQVLRRFRAAAACHDERTGWIGLSRMKGNFHVRS